MYDSRQIFSSMASHYKILVNDSGPIEYCFMPSINISTLGYINQTLANPQPGSQFTSFEIGYNLIVILFGLAINGLIEIVLKTVLWKLKLCTIKT